MTDPTGMHRLCGAAMRRLIALPAGTPSLRLLADQTARVLAGLSDAVDGLALLVADPDEQETVDQLAEARSRKCAECTDDGGEADAQAVNFMMGTGLAAACAAIVAFAVLPNVGSFAGLSIVMARCQSPQ